MRKQLAKRMDEISPFYVMALLKRAKELEQQGRDIIHMEIGEPDFPTPETIVKAGLEFVEKGEIKYTPASGLPELREKIAQFYQHTYGVKIPKERVFITPGASGAFLLALGITLNPDDELLMSDPCYPCNSNFVSLFNARTCFVAVDAKSNYQLTAEQIKQHWQPQTKGVMIASPSNPTGTLIQPQVLREIIEQVDELKGVVFSDEIYHGLVYGQQASTALSVSDEVFVMNSFSKNFGMTGWRVGWLIVPEFFCDAAERLAQNIFISTSTHSQYAALAAFKKSTQKELETRRQQFALRRDYLYQKLLDLGFKIANKPEGAFYIYADCSAFTQNSFKFAEALLETEGLAVTAGKDFGTHQAQHYIRFAYTISIERMAQAMERLENFIRHYNGD